ncbi:unnamed protein product [Rhizoctonia solani]|uniref:Uncharacterized protein n=1 Tax=Rhizoctonia solani TaxID=456999 RepID=A0A8H3GY40_9AGAM|nr:unnamed protein product [Rhizoctonia solani]
MSLFWRHTFVENSRAAYMTALALIIASFIELKTQTLSLLDGLVVSFITTMMITFAIASYSRIPASTSESEERDKSADEKRSSTRWFMQFCFVVFWGAWCFNMWRDPAHFGLKDDAANCDTNYRITIQMFKQVHPTDSTVRNAALALVAVGFSIALLSLFITLEQFVEPIFWAIKKFKERKNNPTLNGDGEVTQETPLDKGFVKYEDSRALQAIHVVFQALAVGTFIFLIYMTEQTISQNDGDGETRDWSYGQTIALILLLQQIMQLFSTFIEQRAKAEVEQEKATRVRGDYPGFPGFEMHTQVANPNDTSGNPMPTTPSALDSK